MYVCVRPFISIFTSRDFYGKYYKKPHKYGVTGRIEQIANLVSDGEYCVLGMLVKKVVRDANEAILVQKRGYKMEGPTTYINMTFEDDTESVMATVGRFDYEEMGKEIAETGKIDKDWYLIFGKYDKQWNKLYTINIRRITRE